MYNVLILGSNGMLGSMVKTILSLDKKFNITCTSRNGDMNSFKFNIENGLVHLERILDSRERYDFIINCIGVLNNEINQKDPVSVNRAIIINASFPYQLSLLAKKYEDFETN